MARNPVWLIFLLSIATMNTRYPARAGAESPTSRLTTSAELTYLPLGDSYTIGEGVPEADRFPNQLQGILQARGQRVALIGNPARSGYTTDLVLREELPLLLEKQPGLTTILTGVNDWVRGYSEKTYRTYFRRLLVEAKGALREPRLLVVLTLPDFSRTRIGPVFARGRNISAGIADFNRIIREESERVGAAVVDLTDLDDAVEKEPGLTAADGLHPSGALYRKWAERIASTIFR